jgi:hypothetical protein
MSPQRLILAVLPALMLLGGCSTYRVMMDYDPEASFAELNRYAWVDEPVPAAVTTPGRTTVVGPILDKRIRKIVADALRERGFEAVGQDQADFLVAYQVAIVDRIDVQTFSDHIGFGYGWGSPYGYYGRYGYYGAYYPSYRRTYVRQYQDGTLIIDVLLPPDGQLIWRSWATRAIEPGVRPEKRDERLTEIVDRMLEAFPPEAAEAAAISTPPTSGS